MGPGKIMTVVANLLVKDTPTLIGDTLVTTSEPGASSKIVPTNTAISSLLTRPVSGFIRKVYILHKRCCVAFAGSVLEAARLIPDLKAHLRKNGVEELVLTEFLTSQSKGRALRLIGWIAAPEPRPFWWSNENSGQVWFDEYDVEGSGTEAFNRIFSAADFAASGGGLTAFEMTAVATLAGIARLLTAETVSGLPLQHAFGFAMTSLSGAVTGSSSSRAIRNSTTMCFSTRMTGACSFFPVRRCFSMRQSGNRQP
jgi:hypothetical protein